MIIEYFSFYNEYDMLELKLQEHAAHVDRFVITESNRTYNQIPKPHRLREQWQRYAPWHDKITYTQFDATGLEPGWPTEQAQREHGISIHTPAPNDIALITDLDEFLTPREFEFMLKHIDDKREILFAMTCYWCFADVVLNRTQPAMAACRYKNYVNTNTHRRPMKVFEGTGDPYSRTLVKQGGIHLTWMGDREQFEQKLQGSIEGYDWSQGRSLDEMWHNKSHNRLFHWKPKFKNGNTRYLALQDNQEMTATMKQFIGNRQEWLLGSKE
jgi:hypothetical protein